MRVVLVRKKKTPFIEWIPHNQLQHTADDQCTQCTASKTALSASSHTYLYLCATLHRCVGGICFFHNRLNTWQLAS